MRIAKAEEDTVLTAREVTTITTRTTTMSRRREGGLSRGITNPISSESHTFVNCEVNDIVKQKMYFKIGNWEK